MNPVNLRNPNRKATGVRVRSSVGAQAMRDETISPVRILVVGDDPSLQRTIVNYLRENSLHAFPACSLEEAARLFAQREPDLVIFNRWLRQEDGLGLLRNFRLQPHIPVIVTAGDAHDEIERIVALELGADDCMSASLSLRELLARIRAVLRRYQAKRNTLCHNCPPRGLYRFGGWELNLRTRRLTNAAGRPVALTKGEYTLLIALLEASGRPVSREYLLRATRLHEDIFDRSIDVQVLRLRRKLEVDQDASRLIETERGVGYVFAIPVERIPRSIAADMATELQRPWDEGKTKTIIDHDGPARGQSETLAGGAGDGLAARSRRVVGQPCLR
jgi:two-component system, OmpR family, response regulator